MRRGLIGSLLCVTFVAVSARSVAAQDFRVSTTVYANEQTTVIENQPVLARTLTILHAGKAYDYIDNIREVTIFDPANEQFTILSLDRELATVVAFEELQHLLNLARSEYEKRIQELENSNSAAAVDIVSQLKFQLEPRFKEHFNEQSHRLTLSSPHLTYEVQCESAEPAKIDAYLRYADGMCRLNYVLHPRLVLPNPRLQVNERLRQIRQIPVEVRLTAQFDQKIRRRAEHKIHWVLGTIERNMINEWESMLRNKKTKFVPFRKYQNAILLSSSSKRR